MAFTRTFPYDTGTFVVVHANDIDINNPETLRGRLGTIACYQCVTNREEYAVMVSGYKDAWYGEYLLEQIRLATDLEVETYKKIMGLKNRRRN